MRRYTDPENQRYVYYVRETVNGYAIQVLNTDRDERYPLTPSIAAQCGLQTGDVLTSHSCTREAAEAQLEELAKMNGLTAIE
jgi:hypothetical protein